MKEILEFIFSSFWTYFGTFVLIAVISRWRMVYINISSPNKTKSDSTNNKPSTFWKDLANLKDSKEDPNPEK